VYPTTSFDKPPTWAADAIWYQIFPDRFRNGDPSNDPRLEDLQGAYPDDMPGPWQVHPWHSDWYERQPWERTASGFWRHVQRRRYGGDLQGVVDSLDHLQRLGINAIYLNPVFDAPSSHKYDASSHIHVDPTLGPDPRGDRERMAREDPGDPRTWTWTSADMLLRELIREVHRRGMRIILDGVFNHVGTRHWAFQDLLVRQRTSPFASWFKVRSWRDEPRGTSFDYEGWFGHRSLPEFLQDEHGLAPGPRDHVFAITRRWMDPDGDGDPSDGIDGWRLDVAFCIRHAFWKSWRTLVRSINPQAYVVAEVIDGVEALRPYLQGDEFDAVMNYPFAGLCASWAIDASMDSATLHARFAELHDAFGWDVAVAQQNLFGSHDTARLGSQVVNRGGVPYAEWQRHFEHSKASNTAYLTRAPDAHEQALARVVAALQMTCVGAPMIYYGDEAGMWGANDPCCRKPMVWPDASHADESTNPDGSDRSAADPVRFDQGMFDWYRGLAGMRSSHPCLRRGRMRSLATSGDLMAFERSLDQERLVVAMHRGSGEATLDLPGIATGRTVLGDPSRCQTTSQGVRVLFKGPDAVVIAPGPGRSG
jgi:glycosidase